MRNIISSFLIFAGSASACEICATHVAASWWKAVDRTGASVFYQFSEYDRPSGGGHEYESHAIQLAVGRRFSERWGLQLGIPYLDRELDGETESGFGDATALAVFRAIRHEAETVTFHADVYAGVKLPTGDSDPLEEERHAALADDEDHAAHPHGHHLALGSGSWDGIFGTRGLLQRNRWQAAVEGQYVLRTEGDFDFEYGDEFIARAGARFAVLERQERSLLIGADISREWRDENEVLGEPIDTGLECP